MERNWDPDLNPHAYGYIIFDKEAKNIKRQKKASSTNGACLTVCLHVEECKLSMSIILYKTQILINKRIQHKTS